MAVFAYRAIELAGAAVREKRGTCSADTPIQARQHLRERGLRVQELAEVRDRSTERSLFTRRLPEATLTTWAQELATLLSAGIPLLEALDATTSQYPGRFRSSLMMLRDQISAGSSLADAMRGQPGVFDELSVCMVDVGERTGMLDEVLAQLAAYRRRSDQFKGRLGTALIYPAIVACAGVAVAVFLSTFVVPRLLETLVDAGRPLPWMTRLVKAFSDLLLGYGWLMLPVVIVCTLLIILSLRQPRVRFHWHRLQLRLPLVGRMMRQQNIVRISVTLSILTRSGMEFVQALGLASRATSNEVLKHALDQAQKEITAGRDIGPSLATTNAFPEPVVRLLEVGQASGRLDQMLERLAADYDLQLQSSTQRLLAILEPAMILLLTGLVGFIVLAVILPYLEAGNVL